MIRLTSTAENIGESIQTKAVEEYVSANAFEAVLCYHSAGNLVYWYYDHTDHLERDHTLAKELGAITGYTVERPEDAVKCPLSKIF